jgi:hypothetical protein
MNSFGVLGALAVWRAVVFVAVTCSPVSPPVGSPYRWLFGDGEECEYKIEGHSTHSARTFWAGRRRAEAERTRHQAPRAAQTVRHLCGRSSDGQLLFLTGMLLAEGRGASFIGRVDAEAGRKAAHLAAFDVLAVARQRLGSLERVTRVVRLDPRFSEEILRSIRQKLG